MATRTQVDLVTRTTLEGELLEGAWATYQVAFDRLRVLAVQRHLMTRAEFDDVCADRRVMKYLGLDDEGRVCAFGTFTNQLSAMPLVSEEYFAHRWPQLHAAGKIWYIGCVGVHPDYRSSGVFARMVSQMCAVVERTGGVASIDICRHNEQDLALPRLITRLVDTVSDGTKVHRLDEQTYWAYEFPEPALASSWR